MYYDNNKSERQNARDLGISRHAAKKLREEQAEASLTDEEKLLLSRGIDPSTVVITSSGISVRDEESGSWTKVNWKPAPAVANNTIDTFDIEEAIRDYIPPKTFTQGPDGASGVLNMSDLQIGKTDLLGGTQGTVSRVLNSVHKAASLIESLGLTSFVVIDNGDIIENIFNTPKQLATNDLPVTGQIRVARRLMLETVKILAPLVEKFYYAAVPSNHCQNRTGFKSAIDLPDDDWGIEISYQLEDALALNNYFDHVEFIRPIDRHLESASITVSNTTLGIVHGHQTKSNLKIADWWKGQQHGNMPTKDADILLVGHWHSFRIETTGDAKWIMVTPTSDPGSSWYSNLTGERSAPGMLFFTVQDGMWHNLEII